MTLGIEMSFLGAASAERRPGRRANRRHRAARLRLRGLGVRIQGRIAFGEHVMRPLGALPARRRRGHACFGMNRERSTSGYWWM